MTRLLIHLQLLDSLLLSSPCVLPFCLSDCVLLLQVLASIGQLEFFYDQAPDVMRSCSMALQLLSVAAGSYLSGQLPHTALSLMSFRSSSVCCHKS